MSRRNKVLVAGLVLLLIFGIVAATPARVFLSAAISRISPFSIGKTVSTSSVPTPVPSPSTVTDVEQRARAAHGWTAAILNSVARGSIVYYDTNGRANSQFGVILAHGYPDQLRIEIDRGDSLETSGFNTVAAWRRNVANLTEAEARDIRAVARWCPERLFLTRAAGSAYRELGKRIEDSFGSPTVPDWTDPVSTSVVPATQITFDEVEITDGLGPVATASNPGDIRRICYYVDSTTSLVTTVRWLEPDNPRKSIDDGTAAFTDMRVDFSDWRDINGVKWPFKMIHSTGGRVDFKLIWSEVRQNASVSPGIFQTP